MVRSFKIAALAGALMMAITPAFAQDPLAGLGDLDPMKILNPAPAPAAAPAAPAKKMHHHKMMHKKMMGKKMMMKKPMMKKSMMKKPMMKKPMMKKM